MILPRYSHIRLEIVSLKTRSHLTIAILNDMKRASTSLSQQDRWLSEAEALNKTLII
jgi:hypothetical protein